MKRFCFTIDDNIRCLKELNDSAAGSLFGHPYLQMLRRLHARFDLKVQLNLFYETEGFDLSRMTDRYRSEWELNSDWLKLSFHSRIENVEPYRDAGYDEILADCRRVNDNIRRFAATDALAKTTTIHYCLPHGAALSALGEQQYVGLLGLFGTKERPRTSYGLDAQLAERLRNGETVYVNGLWFSAIDMVLNCVKLCDIRPQLTPFTERDLVKVMIHEQYFYPDYPAYQPDFEEKLATAFEVLTQQGYRSCFFEDIIA